jgi:predicted TIM-barrel fold metal-dependent hydrolase
MAMERLSGSFSHFTPIDPRKELIQLDPGESVAEYITKRIEEGRLFLGIEGDEDALPAVIDMVGDRAFMFSSDFPHEVNLKTIRHELKELLENGKLPDSTKTAILRDNAQRFYRCE